MSTICVGLAAHLDIHTRLANFPASCTIAGAFYPCRHLDEASCRKPAESDREYFHSGAIKLQLRFATKEIAFEVLTRVLWSWGGMFPHRQFKLERLYIKSHLSRDLSEHGNLLESR